MQALLQLSWDEQEMFNFGYPIEEGFSFFKKNTLFLVKSERYTDEG